MSTSGKSQMVGAHTNVPHWPEQIARLSVDRPTASVYLVAVDAPPTAVDAFVSPKSIRRQTHLRTGLDRSAAAYTAEQMMSDFAVGDCLGLLGPEVDILLLRAEFLSRGLQRSEVHMHATSNSVVRVRCGHCRVETLVTARPGDTVTCSGCALSLYIHHHVSPLHAAYLGFRSDAGRPAPLDQDQTGAWK